LESRITPRVVTLSVVGKTEDAIETSWMTGNDWKWRRYERKCEWVFFFWTQCIRNKYYRVF